MCKSLLPRMNAVVRISAEHQGNWEAEAGWNGGDTTEDTEAGLRGWGAGHRSGNGKENNSKREWCEQRPRGQLHGVLVQPWQQTDGSEPPRARKERPVRHPQQPSPCPGSWRTGSSEKGSGLPGGFPQLPALSPTSLLPALQASVVE